MSVAFGEESFSNRADLTLHLSCPPFHLLTLLLTQVGKNWVLVASRGGSKLRALCQHKGFCLEGCVFLLGNGDPGPEPNLTP